MKISLDKCQILCMLLGNRYNCCDIILPIRALTRLSVLPDDSTILILNGIKRDWNSPYVKDPNPFYHALYQLNDNIPESSFVNRSAEISEQIAGLLPLLPIFFFGIRYIPLHQP
jgi:hypothetical protein